MTFYLNWGLVGVNVILIRRKFGEYFFTNSIMPDGHIYYQTVLFNLSSDQFWSLFMDLGVYWCFTLVVLFLVVFLLVTRKNVGKVFKISSFFRYGSEKMSKN